MGLVIKMNCSGVLDGNFNFGYETNCKAISSNIFGDHTDRLFPLTGLGELVWNPDGNFLTCYCDHRKEQGCYHHLYRCHIRWGNQVIAGWRNIIGPMISFFA